MAERPQPAGLRRRRLLGLLGAATLPAALAAEPPVAIAAGQPPVLLAAGPQGEAISRWAAAAALALGPGFPGGPSVKTQSEGGLDGVTGANRFDALVPTDGSTAAMFPGAALIAWLTGDSRVHFDPTHWVPVMAASNSGVLVVRAGPNGQTASASPTLASLTAPGGLAVSGLRLAVDRPQSSDLAVLLALARMGVPTAPVFGLRGAEAKTAAFLAGAADAVFLCGEGVPEDIAPLAANGGVPIFSLGRMGDDGRLRADPLFPGLPDAMRFGEVAADAPFAGAFEAAAAAARLDFLVALPHLTDPDAVALWQAAAAAANGAPGLGAAAAASSVSLRGAPGAAAELNRLALAPNDQGALQAFLQTRFNWRAG